MQTWTRTDRIRQCADYIVEHCATVRQAAAHFGIGKSTVHADLTKRLPMVDADRYRAVAKVLKLHLDTRHLRGGEKTKEKYEHARIKEK